MLKHIIFDCDGVLLDTEIVAAEVMSAWLRENQVNITTESFIQNHTGKTFSGIIRELQAANELSSDLDIRLGVREIETNVKSNIRPISGVQKALAQIDLPKSVVSNSSVNYIENALSKFKIEHHFKGSLFSSEQVAAPKPSPLVYELAMQEIGIPKGDIVVVEDSTTGVMAAHKAGLQVIGFLGGSHILDGYKERLLDVGAFTTVNDHLELMDFIKNPPDIRRV